MKINKYIILALLLTTGCTSMKFWIPSYSFDEVIAIKAQIDAAENPAKGFLLLKQLERKRVTVNNAIVKQISNSINIDYTFSVIATVEHSSGPIDCYIYTRNWRNEEDFTSVARLKSGDTIYVIGRFSRFLKLPGNKYAVELVESNISKLK
ncbi:MAG TPA: hypothetical protein PLO73_04885 [Spirochaetota bacterium]|nr:hypothetical protein [Spirochaetota bacterium]HPP49286.1 hypothetical protein [Spirochaetota bacterium]